MPGDKIIGYVTRGRGVAIHRADCLNIINASSNEIENERLIPVSWADENSEASFRSILKITASDRPNLLLDIMKLVGEYKLPVINVNARKSNNDLAIIELTTEISNTIQLDIITQKIKNLDSVLGVVRRRQ